jgi:hypothetical protein
MKIWIEVIPEYDYSWSCRARTAKIGKIYKRRPSNDDVLAAGRIVEVEVRLPVQFLTPTVTVDLF